jgi:hypothetical protein
MPLSRKFNWVIVIEGVSRELYNGIPNVTVWRALRKRLHLEVYKRFRNIRYTVKLEYHCNALSETLCIANGILIEP